MRLPAAILALTAVLPARGETPEEACRFAEALSDRLRMPDHALRYLESARAKAPDDRKTAFDASLLGILESLARLETDPARREAVVQRARAAAKPTLDKLAPTSKTSDFSLGDFRVALAFLRIDRTAALAGNEPGAGLKRVHLELARVYAILENTLYQTSQEDDAKVDLMVEYEMFHGDTGLQARSPSFSAGLPEADRLALLKAGLEKFTSARLTYEDETRPDVVFFPHASLGQARCLRALAELTEGSDPAASRKSLDESRRILSQVVGNPMNPNLPASEALLMRYRAAQEILQASARLKDFGAPRTALAAFRQKAGARGEGKERGDLLQAQIDWEEASRMNKPDLAARAKQTLSDLKAGAGSAAAEAEALLADWEGASGKPGGVNWKKAADEALAAKSFDAAVRKYRAGIRTAGRGRDQLVQDCWFGIAECYKVQKRPLEAIVAAERAAACLMTGKSAGYSALVGAAAAQGLPYPPAATKGVRRRCYRLLTQFESLPESQLGAYLLGLIYMDDRDYALAEAQFASVKPENDTYPKALYSLGRCRVRRLKALEREGKGDPALAEAAESALAKFLEGGFKGKDLAPYMADAAYLRAELNSQLRPETALRILDGFGVSYPDARDLLADVPRLRSIALAAKGDFAASEKAWTDVTAALGEKPWPQATAQALLKLCADKPAAAAFKMTLTNQIAQKQPFVFTKSAARFKENVDQKRWADAVEVGERILEETSGNPAYEKDEVNARWLKHLRTVRLPECYVKTEAWAKAVPLLAETQDLRIIQGKYELPGQVPPPLMAEDVELWQMAALASVRWAEELPAGEERKAVAARAAKSWRKLLERLSREDERYWTSLLDTLKSEILAGQYQAAKERLHGIFISYPELGGQKDRFLEMLKGLPQTEPGFAEVGAAMAAEID